jgi:hypothetical protein
MAVREVTEYGTRVVFRRKTKKYKLETEEFWGPQHGTDAVKFVHKSLHVPVAERGESIANYFSIEPATRITVVG